MDEKKVQELELEEMDKVSGGAHDGEVNRKGFFDYACPYCNASFPTHRDRCIHIRDSHRETMRVL